MARKSTSYHRKPAAGDDNKAGEAKKERIIKELCLIFTRLGYYVRRERLKQGHGWRVVSGSCRAHGSKYIFVDRRLSQNDQISFLLSKLIGQEAILSAHTLEGVSSDTLAHLPKVTRVFDPALSAAP